MKSVTNVYDVKYWPNSLDCTDLKIGVEPAVTQNCVPLLHTTLNIMDKY